MLHHKYPHLLPSELPRASEKNKKKLLSASLPPETFVRETATKDEDEDDIVGIDDIGGSMVVVAAASGGLPRQQAVGLPLKNATPPLEMNGGGNLSSLQMRTVQRRNEQLRNQQVPHQPLPPPAPLAPPSRPSELSLMLRMTTATTQGRGGIIQTKIP
jgi:hypothetical protein